jgi:hypothetical protein
MKRPVKNIAIAIATEVVVNYQLLCFVMKPHQMVDSSVQSEIGF